MAHFRINAVSCLPLSSVEVGVASWAFYSLSYEILNLPHLFVFMFLRWTRVCLSDPYRATTRLMSLLPVCPIVSSKVPQIRIRRQLMSYALGLWLPGDKRRTHETQSLHQRGDREWRSRPKNERVVGGVGTEDWGVTRSNTVACEEGQLSSQPL